jgi:hypothetical protein
MARCAAGPESRADETAAAEVDDRSGFGSGETDVAGALVELDEAEAGGTAAHAGAVVLDADLEAGGELRSLAPAAGTAPVTFAGSLAGALPISEPAFAGRDGCGPVNDRGPLGGAASPAFTLSGGITREPTAGAPASRSSSASGRESAGGEEATGVRFGLLAPGAAVAAVAKLGAALVTDDGAGDSAAVAVAFSPLTSGAAASTAPGGVAAKAGPSPRAGPLAGNFGPSVAPEAIGVAAAS